MRVLVACERSGIVRDAFRRFGHDAWSCDIEACESDPQFHMQCDMFEITHLNWDMIIAHPSCTYLCSSGLHWNSRTPGRSDLTDAALAFVERIWRLPIEKKCIENPMGCINTRLPFMPKPQYVQPYEFGHDASKKTGLWLSNLSPLDIDPRQFVWPRLVEWPKGSGKLKQRWSNQTDSGQNKLGPSEKRMMERARTYRGIADAMALKWGGYV